MTVLKTADYGKKRSIDSEEGQIMVDTWLTTLITDTPQEGFELAITLSRRGVKYTQPDPEVLHRLRPQYSTDPDSLTAASQVVAINFQTVAAANDYWR
jgi:hypothetical protein